MTHRGSSSFRALAAAAAFALLAATPVAAQFQSGNLYGTATDGEGPIAGVKLVVTGHSGAREQISDAHGQFRFLGLDPGNYSLRAEHERFATVVYNTVEILVGRPTTVQIQMSPIPGETIVVTSEPPLLQAGKIPTGITVTRFELDRIPTSRDPWAVAAQAPGVLIAATNVGGNESAQQVAFVGPGAKMADNTFAVDGVVITDMAAIGASPMYYDMDQLEQVEVTVGGPEVAVGSSGVVINMVSKRGSNLWRGSARYLLTDDAFDTGGNVDRSDFGPGQEQIPTNTTDSVAEYGAEGGGRLIRDRLWAWGSFGLIDIDAVAAGGLPDDTELENSAFRLDGQITDANSATASLRLSDKRRGGRGAGPTRAPETVWDQSGPIEFGIFEDSHLFAPNLQLTGRLAFVDTDFVLAPRGGRDAEVRLDEHGIWRGTFAYVEQDRDVRQLTLEGATFLAGAGLDHELRFGASLREFPFDYEETWGARNLIHFAGENLGTPYDQVEAFRSFRSVVEQRYRSAWLQDTLKGERLTLSLGLRYDLQDGRTETLRVEANPAFPEVLPAIEVPAQGPDFRWESLSPRLGATWTLGREADFLVSASLSRFPSQFHTLLADRTTALFYADATFGFDDLDGDSIFDPGEPHFLLSFRGLDPDDPAAVASPNVTDPRLGPELTDEALLGIQHELRHDLVVGLRFAYRRVEDMLEARRLVREESGAVRSALREDYVLDRLLSGTLPDGTSYHAPVYRLREGLELTGGRFLTNGDRRQEYVGGTFEITKRLADRWMLRGHFTAGDWRWRLGPEFLRHDDPTDLAPSLDDEGISDSADTQGDVVAEKAIFAGPKEGIFLNSRWSFDLTAFLQIAPRRRWAFNAAANVSGREGFPAPYYVTVVPSDGIRRAVQVTRGADSFRLDDLYTVDLRLEKEWARGDLGAVVSLEAFNLFDEGSVLERSLQLNGPRPDHLVQTLAPRALRLGVRLRWR